MLVGWDAARADVLIGFDLARGGWVILLKHIVDSHRYRKSYRTVQFSFMITHPPFGPELTTRCVRAWVFQCQPFNAQRRVCVGLPMPILRRVLSVFDVRKHKARATPPGLPPCSQAVVGRTRPVGDIVWVQVEWASGFSIG